jgi:cobyrinic acid a,c-diamide synthase
MTVDRPIANDPPPASLPRLLISAAHKSSGKTTVSIGLSAAFRATGVVVQPYKKGPDYIDPLWLSVASGRNCHNLDFFLMNADEIVSTVAHHAADADLALIEGNKGLYDGLDLHGSNSNAALATLLQAPVVLVLDARGMTRGIAPLILGYQQFDRDIRIAGVILNRLGGSRHESKLRAVIEHYTNVPVLGAIHEDEQLRIVERHLGLMPTNEAASSAETIGTLAAAIANQVDLPALRAIAASAPHLPSCAPAITAPSRPDVRIGIARDAAFAFYYAGDLAALREAGAELVPIDTLRDNRLPPIDALFIGGGFPETHLQALEANVSLRRQIRAAIEAGMPAYAECGGLMYLARRITWGARTADMVGAIPGDVVMHDRPVGRGYVVLRETGVGPWPATTAVGPPPTVRAHEFHYSSIVNLPPDTRFAYEMMRGQGVDGRRDGIVYKNVLASYAHLRDVAGSRWTTRFVQFVRNQRQGHAASY